MPSPGLFRGRSRVKIDIEENVVTETEPDERKVTMFIISVYAILFFAAVMGAGWAWDSMTHSH